MSEPSVTAVKTLFAHSRNLCFFTKCEEKLTNPVWVQVNAEIAHIKGERPRSARYDSLQPDSERQGYDNLMLLCPNHHKVIDRLEPARYDVDTLVDMRAAHLNHFAESSWCSDTEAESFALLAIQDYRDQEPRLRILEAKYGENEVFANVTDLVARAVVNDTLRLPVTNDMMGGDPLVNVVKRLSITYQLDGTAYNKSFAENEEATLP